MKLTLRLFVFAVLFCCTLAACTSRPPIAVTATAMEIIQKAQEATDRDRYNLAIYYYNAILERFPSDNTASCTAQYEIAFIHYKQKKYVQSKTEFEELLLRYSQRNNQFLPQEYKILSNIVLKKIDEKIKRLKLEA